MVGILKGVLFILCCYFSTILYGQEKEILIIGVMHEIPKIVKNSYNPLLKFAKKYKPEAIYVEYIQPCDTISMNFYTPEFVKQSDSLRSILTFNDERFNELQKLQLSELNADDFDFLAKAYLILKDRANYQYYSYLRQYGKQGPEKPLRNESADLIFKLAISVGIKNLYPMDDHQTTDKYYEAWRNNIKSGARNGDNHILNKLADKDYNRSIIPALFGNLGKYTNKEKSLYRKHLINSGRYTQNMTSEGKTVAKYWDARNYRMARNIAEQVNAKSFRRNIVIVGAGHVIGLKEALEKNYPKLKIKLMYKFELIIAK